MRYRLQNSLNFPASILLTFWLVGCPGRQTIIRKERPDRWSEVRLRDGKSYKERRSERAGEKAKAHLRRKLQPFRIGLTRILDSLYIPATNVYQYHGTFAPCFNSAGPDIPSPTRPSEEDVINSLPE